MSWPVEIEDPLALWGVEVDPFLPVDRDRVDRSGAPTIRMCLAREPDDLLGPSQRAFVSTAMAGDLGCCCPLPPRRGRENTADCGCDGRERVPTGRPAARIGFDCPLPATGSTHLTALRAECAGCRGRDQDHRPGAWPFYPAIHWAVMGYVRRPTTPRSVRGTQPKSATARQPDVRPPGVERCFCGRGSPSSLRWSFVVPLVTPSVRLSQVLIAVAPQCDVFVEGLSLHSPALGARAFSPALLAGGVPHRWRPPTPCGRRHSPRPMRTMIIQIAKTRSAIPGAMSRLGPSRVSTAPARDLRLQRRHGDHSGDRQTETIVPIGRSTTGSAPGVARVAPNRSRRPSSSGVRGRLAHRHLIGTGWRSTPWQRVTIHGCSPPGPASTAYLPLDVP